MYYFIFASQAPPILLYPIIKAEAAASEIHFIGGYTGTVNYIVSAI